MAGPLLLEPGARRTAYSSAARASMANRRGLSGYSVLFGPYSASRSYSSGHSMSRARAPSAIGASKNPTSYAAPPITIGKRSTRAPALTPRYFGSATVTSHPSRANAGGSEPSTSARPPLFAKGCASEPTSSTEGWSLVTETLQFERDRTPGPCPARRSPRHRRAEAIEGRASGARDRRRHADGSRRHAAAGAGAGTAALDSVRPPVGRRAT